MDSDSLWRPEFDTPQDDYRTYRNLWLREHATTTRPPMSLLDTSRLGVERSVAETTAWFHQFWPPESVQQAPPTMQR